MTTTQDQQAAVFFLLIVSATVEGLRREYAKVISAKVGPLDHGYHGTFVEPLEDYLVEQFYGYWRRESIRAARLQALRAGG